MKENYLVPVIIAGPTASGKSRLALELAKRHHGEIVCADSRQFYSGMRIGTACPTDNERAQIPHHGYESIDPAMQKIDAGFFVQFATRTITEIQARKKRPIIVGGTGLYLRSLAFGLSDVPSSDKNVVHALMVRADTLGIDALYEELTRIDPESARHIMRTDRYRIIRALEIFEVTGKKPSLLRTSFKDKVPKITAHWMYKKPNRPMLMETIAHRVDAMFDAGLVDEAVRLRHKLPKDHWALSVMGYEEALQFADGSISLEDAKIATATRHRHYAKRQFTWFNKESFYHFAIS